jgi:undecaprenyl-diphosphatase
MSTWRCKSGGQRLTITLFAVISVTIGLAGFAPRASASPGYMPSSGPAVSETQARAAGPVKGGGASDSADAAPELSLTDALVLGVVEGVTEYLPVSSTGHLVVTARLLGLDTEGAPGDALDSYIIVIQVGAIAAVLALYRRRISQMLAGIAGRDETGRRLLVALALAFLPAAVIALGLQSFISDSLLEPGPVAAAWLVGGVGLVMFGRQLRERGRFGWALDRITARQATLIGFAQALAVWPGVSRSLVTIVGGVLVGLTLSAAVEFSFLLGLVTLSAATGYELVTNGSTIVDQLGGTSTVVGIVAAFVSAMAAVKFLVEYLNRHDLRLFGWYRIGVGVVTLVLLATGAI